MKHHILLKERSKFLAKGIDIPKHVWRSKPFQFKPLPFGVENDRLNEKVIGSDVQEKSLQNFIDNPLAPCIYGVGSAPSDEKAKYFAAYLIQQYVLGVPAHRNRVCWQYLYSNFDNPIITRGETPGLIVLTGLTPNSSPVKLDKARDILEHFSDVPRIVVIAGEDPLTYFSTRLYFKLTHLFFTSEKIVKRRVEVI